MANLIRNPGILVFSLSAFAKVASSHIAGHIYLHVLLPKLLSQTRIHLGVATVHGMLGFMGFSEYLGAKGDQLAHRANLYTTSHLDHPHPAQAANPSS